MAFVEKRVDHRKIVVWLLPSLGRADPWYGLRFDERCEIIDGGFGTCLNDLQRLFRWLGGL